MLSCAYGIHRTFGAIGFLNFTAGACLKLYSLMPGAGPLLILSQYSKPQRLLMVAVLRKSMVTWLWGDPAGSKAWQGWSSSDLFGTFCAAKKIHSKQEKRKRCRTGHAYFVCEVSAKDKNDRKKPQTHAEILQPAPDFCIEEMEMLPVLLMSLTFSST